MAMLDYRSVTPISNQQVQPSTSKSKDQGLAGPLMVAPGTVAGQWGKGMK